MPVHPIATEILGLKAYPRVTRHPVAVDLVIVAVPAAQVEAVVDDCLAKGVRAICIITAGFGECGDEGRARERAIVAKARAAGCRVIGPNCMGLLNTDPAVQLNATFSPIYPPAGNVAMSTQSGALGLAILDYAKKLNIGISSFVSVGNKADVSGNDLLEYWEADPQNVGHPAVSRKLRKSREVLAPRPAHQPAQADRRAEVRPLGGRCASRGLAHRRARLLGCVRRRAVPPVGRDSHRHRHRALRRGVAPVAAAAAARAAASRS